MAKLRYLSLFSGIGGFELAIQSAFPDKDIDISNMLNDYIASGGEPIESGQLELSFL